MPEKIKPKSALLIVDVQNDFISGTLSLLNCPSKHNGNEIVPKINTFLTKHEKDFDQIIWSRDWHPKDHISFYENREIYKKPEGQLFEKVELIRKNDKNGNSEKYQQILWPAHCVQDTYGAEYHKDLIKPNLNSNVQNTKHKEILKGQNPICEAYSAFFDNYHENETGLHNEIKEKIENLYIVGIATDVCVNFAVLDSLELGYKVFVVMEGCRGVDEKVIEEEVLPDWKKKGAVILERFDELE